MTHIHSNGYVMVQDSPDGRSRVLSATPAGVGFGLGVFFDKALENVQKTRKIKILPSPAGLPMHSVLIDISENQFELASLIRNEMDRLSAKALMH